jgi:hypothetical protein
MLAWEYLGNQTPVITRTQGHGMDSTLVLSCLNVTPAHVTDKLDLFLNPVRKFESCRGRQVEARSKFGSARRRRVQAIGRPQGHAIVERHLQRVKDRGKGGIATWDGE